MSFFFNFAPFKFFLTTLDPLHFHIYMYISTFAVSIKKKNPAGIFISIALKLWFNLAKKNVSKISYFIIRDHGGSLHHIVFGYF